MFVQPLGNNRPPTAVTQSVTTGTTALTITLAAVEGAIHVIHGLQWSYSTNSTTGRVLVTTATATLFDIDVTASGPGSITPLLHSTIANQAVVVTLATSGGTGKLNVQSTLHF